MILDLTQNLELTKHDLTIKMDRGQSQTTYLNFITVMESWSTLLILQMERKIKH